MLRTDRVVPLLLACLFGVAAEAAPLPTTDPEEAISRPGPIGRGDDAAAASLVGTKAPALPALRWLDGKSRSLASLEGRVVVIRSFTNECPFCAATIPSLQRLHERYGDRVTFLGVYHPKPPAPTASGDVAAFVKSLGVTFPVAVDEDWSLVRAWWQDLNDAPWTSITWVLDGTGTIRFVHPGGEYHEDGGGSDHARCRSDYRRLEQILGSLSPRP
jgi:thiol-disulfide isomerase/thioredoxin